MSNSKRSFDFTRYKQRYIALKILYFGWDYDGLAEQNNNSNTIEYHLFSALRKTCLIESTAECGYNRCGRTDKGVSSYAQVVNLAIRSNLLDEVNNYGLFTPKNHREGPKPTVNQEDKQIEELNYVDILNRVLPSHIRAVAWAPVGPNFSSRFDCKSRSYSYIIPRGDLCVASMEKALEYLIGEHDFRNLCSFDLKNGVTNHSRTILQAHIRPIFSVSDSTQVTAKPCNPYSFLEIIIVGQAFLYHQIRCIMTIILLVGAKREPPELIESLLDINKCPARPNYNRASPVPLSLFDCQYNPSQMPSGWIHDPRAIFNVHKQLKQLWLHYKTRSMMIERALSTIHPLVEGAEENQEFKDVSWRDFGLECDNMSDSKYIAILKRPRDETLEHKLEVLKKKKTQKVEATTV